LLTNATRRTLQRREKRAARFFSSIPAESIAANPAHPLYRNGEQIFSCTWLWRGLIWAVEISIVDRLLVIE
jgi:hypothetical protein